MKDSEGERRHRDACGVHVGVVDPSCAGGLVTLEEPDDLPKQHRLNDLDDFLIRKIKAVTGRAMLLNNPSLRTCTEAQYLYKHVRSDEGVRSPETLNQDFGEFR